MISCRAVFGGKENGLFGADLESMVELYQRETAELMEMLTQGSRRLYRKIIFERRYQMVSAQSLKSSAAIIELRI